MESKAKILGHPIHPILIVFPLGRRLALLLEVTREGIGGEASGRAENGPPTADRPIHT